MSNKIKNFKALISFLSEKNINYALLGRKSSLKEIVDGDIDIVISKKNFQNIERTIDSFCYENKLMFLQNFQHESVAKYLILADEQDHSIICPDFCYDYIRNARFLIHAETLLKNNEVKLVENYEVKVLKPEYEFIYYFLKKIDKSEISDGEFNHLTDQINNSNKVLINTLLKEYFSEDSIIKINKVFNETKEQTLDEKLINQLREDLHKKKKIKVYYLSQDLLTKLKRVFNKTGLSISIMGSDGSGKSTIINILSKNLSASFRQIHYYHLKPVEPKNDGVVVQNPQGQMPYSFLKSIIKLLYLIYQYNLGFFKVHFKLIKSTLVIFDRYLDDIIIDKLRFRFGAPIIFAKAALFFIPKPKMYFFLDAPGEVIFKRKEELSVEEINRQRVEYHSLFKNKANRYIIDASRTPNEVVKDIEKIIFNYLIIRQKGRL